MAVVTWFGHVALPVNATTIGFAYLLLILIVASTWGFYEAVAASLPATLWFNLYFLPPVGRLTIADPQNWVAFFSFLVTSLVASRLSAEAKHRALDALARKQDVERLYTFSRAILLIEKGEPFPKQLVSRLADIFELAAVVLYERRSEEFYRAGPSDFDGLDDQLRDAALLGTAFSDAPGSRVITAVRLGVAAHRRFGAARTANARFGDPGHQQSGGDRFGTCPRARSGRASGSRRAERTTAQHAAGTPWRTSSKRP